MIWSIRTPFFQIGSICTILKTPKFQRSPQVYCNAMVARYETKAWRLGPKQHRPNTKLLISTNGKKSGISKTSRGRSKLHRAQLSVERVCSHFQAGSAFVIPTKEHLPKTTRVTCNISMKASIHQKDWRCSSARNLGGIAPFGTPLSDQTLYEQPRTMEGSPQFIPCPVVIGMAQMDTSAGNVTLAGLQGAPLITATVSVSWHTHVDRLRPASYSASGLKPAETIQKMLSSMWNPFQSVMLRWSLCTFINTVSAAWHTHMDRLRPASYSASGLKPSETIQYMLPSSWNPFQSVMLRLF